MIRILVALAFVFAITQWVRFHRRLLRVQKLETQRADMIVLLLQKTQGQSPDMDNLNWISAEIQREFR